MRTLGYIDEHRTYNLGEVGKTAALTFTFRDYSSTSLTVAQHWFQLALSWMKPELDRVAAAHGYAYDAPPFETLLERTRYPIVEIGELFASIGEPTGDVLGPLGSALVDPSVGVCGPSGSR